jgi:hypothetical protein
VQGHRAIVACGDDEPQLSQGVTQQDRQRLQHLRIVYLVQVLQDQYDRMRKSCERAGGPAHEDLVDPRSETNLRERAVTGDGAGVAKRAEQMGPERSRVVVVGVQREPRDRSGDLAGLDPGPDQQGLARAGPGRDERNLCLRTLIQPGDEAPPGHERGRKVWPGELGREQAARVARR